MVFHGDPPVESVVVLARIMALKAAKLGRIDTSTGSQRRYRPFVILAPSLGKERKKSVRPLLLVLLLASAVVVAFLWNDPGVPADAVAVRTWVIDPDSPTPVPEMEDPELAVPWLKDRPSFGIAFSGGRDTLGKCVAWPDSRTQRTGLAEPGPVYQGQLRG